VLLVREIDSVANCVQRHWSPIRIVSALKVSNTECFNLGHTGNAPNRVIQEVDECVVIDGDDFGDDVEAAGGHDDVVGFVNRAILSATSRNVTVDADPDERFAAITELQRIGNRDDLHDAGILEALHATSHARFGESDFVCDGAVARRPSRCRWLMICRSIESSAFGADEISSEVERSALFLVSRSGLVAGIGHPERSNPKAPMLRIETV